MKTSERTAGDVLKSLLHLPQRNHSNINVIGIISHSKPEIPPIQHLHRIFTYLTGRAKTSQMGAHAPTTTTTQASSPSPATAPCPQTRAPSQTALAPSDRNTSLAPPK